MLLLLYVILIFKFNFLKDRHSTDTSLTIIYFPDLFQARKSQFVAKIKLQWQWHSKTHQVMTSQRKKKKNPQRQHHFKLSRKHYKQSEAVICMIYSYCDACCEPSIQHRRYHTYFIIYLFFIFLVILMHCDVAQSNRSLNPYLI